MEIEKVDESNFAQKVLQTDAPVLVDFYAVKVRFGLRKWMWTKALGWRGSTR